MAQIVLLDSQAGGLKFHMRVVKVILVLAGLLAATQCLLCYYNSSSFNSFVAREAERCRNQDQLRETVLDKARSYSIPITDSDIEIYTEGSIFRVAINYKMPVNLFVFRPEFKFHVAAAGLLSARE